MISLRCMRNCIKVMILLVLCSFKTYSQTSDTIKLHLGWDFQFQFAGYIAAKELGLYQKEGINIQLVTDKYNWGVDKVIKGKYHYGVATGAQLLSNKNRDQLVVLASIFQISPIALITDKESDFNILNKLVGQNIAAGTEVKAMLQSAGIALDRVNFTNPTTNYQHFLDNQALTFYITDFPYLDVDVYEKYNIFRPIEYGINFYGESLYTTKREKENNPQRLEKILKASIEGWKYAVENPEIVAQWINKKYSPEKPIESLLKESELVIHSLIQPIHYEIGAMNKDKWIEMESTLRKLNITNPLPNGFFDTFIYNTEKEKQEQYLNNLILYSSITLGALLIIAILSMIFILQLKKKVKKRTDKIQRQYSLLKQQKEELEENNHFKSKMLSIVSHDIRGPLSSLHGIIHLFNECDTDPKEIKMLMERVGFQVHEMTRFLENLLYWAKSQLQGININKEPFEIGNLINSNIGLFTLTIESKGIILKNNIAKKILVSADKEMINLVVRNVLSNAIKFCKKDDIISIDLKETHEFIELQIADTGIGMNDLQLNKLFSKNPVIRKGLQNESGTGLGLQLCQEYIHLNGGEIRAISNKNDGTTICLTLKKVFNTTSKQ